ncbi:hypothetical protein [Bradyrhizobium archetypum]|jgi:hypothetical protein|nr:hypothetical protein [Bradyrhizobium archetypum]
MLETVLLMATITIIACAAVILVSELITRARPPEAGAPPRRWMF